MWLYSYIFAALLCIDCIGSAFNTKGAMQCPNCRKIEEGKWLFANGSTRSLPEFGMEEWTFSEEPYEISYSEMVGISTSFWFIGILKASVSSLGFSGLNNLLSNLMG